MRDGAVAVESLPVLAASVLSEIQKVFTAAAASLWDPLGLLVNEILQARHGQIVFQGIGSEGLMMRALAKRLDHLGLNANFAFPSVDPNHDLFIVSAGPGSSSDVDGLVSLANPGARIVIITTHPDGHIASLADKVAVLPVAAQENDGMASENAYEGALFVLIQMLVSELTDKLMAKETKIVKPHTRFGLNPPTNPMVTPLLTDMYQITMAYSYWKAGKHLDSAVFDLLYRKTPFGGEFTVFAGLEECIRFAANFKFEDYQINYLRKIMPASCEEEFFDCLRQLDCSDVVIYAIPEGSVVFPRVPLIRVEGPLWIAQMLETTFLTLVNYASLVSTNAARHRLVAGNSKSLLEFGLRRAQGPDGGISASKYCYLGGFDATSNLDAGRRFNIPVRGTHSHAFVSSFMSFDEIVERSLPYANGVDTCQDFVDVIQHWFSRMQGLESLKGIFSETNQSELAAFSSYALAFPSDFLALVDTYDVMKSGIPNFCAVALALETLGYKARGIRLDSGDLSYLSIETRKFFRSIEKEFGIVDFGKMTIIASNDINEDTLDALNKQGHEVDAFGIGTHLVTCYTQPALGCVYKLVEVNGQPRIKISEDVSKVTIPCKKQCYRLYGKDGYALVDLMTGENEAPPKIGERILCRHPFSESKRAYVNPQRVEALYKCYWAGKSGSNVEELPTLEQVKERCQKQLGAMRADHMRSLNPTPYKVSVSGKLYDFIHFLWLNEAPVGELL